MRSLNLFLSLQLVAGNFYIELIHFLAENFDKRLQFLVLLQKIRIFTLILFAEVLVILNLVNLIISLSDFRLKLPNYPFQFCNLFIFLRDYLVVFHDKFFNSIFVQFLSLSDSLFVAILCLFLLFLLL